MKNKNYVLSRLHQKIFRASQLDPRAAVVSVEWAEKIIREGFADDEEKQRKIEYASAEGIVKERLRDGFSGAFVFRIDIPGVDDTHIRYKAKHKAFTAKTMPDVGDRVVLESRITKAHPDFYEYEAFVVKIIEL